MNGKNAKTAVVVAIIVFLVLLLYRKKSQEQASARIVYTMPVTEETGSDVVSVSYTPYWTLDEESSVWRGRNGESIPAIRDTLGYLSAPPEPPDA